MIGIALFAVLMSVNFASCNEEELPQYELITGEKKIVRIEIDSSELGNSIWEFNYDSKGRLLEATCSKGQENEKYNYAWSNNSIKSSNGTYYLSDGLIHNGRIITTLHTHLRQGEQQKLEIHHHILTTILLFGIVILTG